MSACLWSSRNCNGEVELYRIVVGGQEVERHACRFHGQAWPKVTETEDEADRRTRSARLSLTNRGRQTGARASRARGRAASARTNRQRRETASADVKEEPS